MKMREQCARADEDAFGPVVRGCLNGFDFTLLFEETILFVLPALCLLLLALVWRIPELLRANSAIRTSLLGFSKLVSSFCIRKQSVEGFVTLRNQISQTEQQMIHALVFMSQVVFLVFVCKSDAANTRATIPVTVVGLITIIVMSYLSYLEHRRSLRPSSILTLYLLAAAPMNAARCRTLWHMPSPQGVVVTFIVTACLMFIALVFELAPKDSLVEDEVEKASPEEQRGIVERSLLTWIAGTFMYGYKHTLTPEMLPAVESRLGVGEPLKLDLEGRNSGI